MNIRPPDVKESWDDNTNVLVNDIIAYSQIRDYEDQEVAARSISGTAV